MKEKNSKKFYIAGSFKNIKLVTDISKRLLEVYLFEKRLLKRLEERLA